MFLAYQISCTVTVSGGPSGHTTLAETTPGTTSTCNVPLPSSVPAGTYQVTATVGKVPLETNLTNNTQTYSVQFQ